MTNASKRVETNARAQFPGGGVDPEPGELRIAIDKKAYAEIIGHAVLEPEVEVCGVLVGRVLQDHRGEFLHITAAIRGEAAKQQGAQVTFTHETWNHIHREMDQKYADRQMVGWYHTHGGFGIFLSDMDMFIHRNFFSAPYQVAFVFDPLAGTEGFFHAREGQLVLCRRHWVGGRERKAVPRDVSDPAPASGGGKPAGDFASVATALQRTAVALQALATRPQESVPFIVWIAAAVLALALAVSLLTGRGLFGGHADESKRTGAMLIVQRDPRTGVGVGFELHQTVPVDGASVVRDENGRIYLVAGELRGLEGSAPALSSVFGADRTAPDPAQAEPPPAASPFARRSLMLWAAAAAVALAALGVAAWLWLRRGEARA